MTSSSKRAPYGIYALLGTVLLFGATSTVEAQAIPGPRLRIGIEGGVGGEWGTPRGASAGLFGQLGVQLNNTLAIFYQPSVIFHAMSRDEDPELFAAFGNLGMLDLTLGFLQLGVGGGMDVGRFVDCDRDGNDCVEGPRLANPAVGGRIAGVISFPGIRGRIGIPIGFHIHSTFFDDDARVTSLILTVGVQRF